jgi:phospholipase C
MSTAESALNRIDHIVVLMLENRSFDNVLGWLYDPENKSPFDQVPPGQKFEGVSGKRLCNPRPGSGDLFTGDACVGKGTSMIDPFPDPNEPYDDVYAQMYNDHTHPSPIPNRTDSPSMGGFVINYASAIKAAGATKKGCSRILSSLFRGNSPMATDPGIIMNCYTPESLPVISTLANAYGVCDHWFSSVPTQTFPNRSFVHAATSSGYITNGWKTGPHAWDIGYLLNKTDTIYNLLSRAQVDWRIYYGGPFLLCNALLIQEKLWEFVPLNRHFFPMAQFLEDAKKPGGLPSYTFIEPNMLCSRKYGPENDMHPAFAMTETGTATNVLYGEELILNVYKALVNSPDWNSTLLVITFDEHGGCYDHVPTPPPAATPPDDLALLSGQPGYSGFDFKRYGVRVPAVLVSPWIKQGTVCNTVFDHTSILKTVSNRWLGGQYLTERDRNATDLSEILASKTVRDDAPEIMPNLVPPFHGCGAHPLSDMHRHLIAAAADRVMKHTGEVLDLDRIMTTEDAVTALDAREESVRNRVK